jgi:cobalt-zinc-cadmium efflux system protein
MHRSSFYPNSLTLNPKLAAYPQRSLLWAIALISSFAGLEWLVGYSSHSLALVAEALHLASDCVALGLAVAATWLSPPASRDGWIGTHQLALQPHRSAANWAALINGGGLVVLAGWMGWTALEHWQRPGLEIASTPMLLTAIAGVAVNGINLALLHRGSRFDLNLKGAFLHVLADLLGSLGVIAAAITVAVFHWLQADCIISAVIAGFILTSAMPLIRQSWRALGLSLYTRISPPDA